MSDYELPRQDTVAADFHAHGTAKKVRTFAEYATRDNHRNYCFDANPKQSAENLQPMEGTWKTDAFIGIFGDPFILGTELEGGRTNEALHSVSTHLLQMSENLLERSATKHMQFFLADVFPTADASTCATTLKIISGIVSNAINHNKFDPETISDIVAKLKSLPNKGMMLLTGGWRSGNGGHAFMYVFVRNGDAYDIVICNTGNGLQHHATTTEFFPKSKQRVCAMMPKVPASRATSPAFIFFLVRMTNVDDRVGQGVSLVYDFVLPYLADGPFSFNTAPPADAQGKDALSEYRSVQLAGTCYIKSIVAAVRYMLSAKGFSRKQIKAVMMVMRLMYLEEAATQLEAVKSPTRSLRGSDVRVLQMAMHQTVLKVVKGIKSGWASAETVSYTGGLLDRIREALPDFLEDAPRVTQPFVTPFPAHVTYCRFDFHNFDVLQLNKNTNFDVPRGGPTKQPALSALDWRVLDPDTLEGLGSNGQARLNMLTGFSNSKELPLGLELATSYIERIMLRNVGAPPCPGDRLIRGFWGTALDREGRTKNTVRLCALLHLSELSNLYSTLCARNHAGNLPRERRATMVMVHATIVAAIDSLIMTEIDKITPLYKKLSVNPFAWNSPQFSEFVECMEGASPTIVRVRDALIRYFRHPTCTSRQPFSLLHNARQLCVNGSSVYVEIHIHRECPDLSFAVAGAAACNIVLPPETIEQNRMGPDDQAAYFLTLAAGGKHGEYEAWLATRNCSMRLWLALMHFKVLSKGGNVPDVKLHWSYAGCSQDGAMVIRMSLGADLDPESSPPIDSLLRTTMEGMCSEAGVLLSNFQQLSPSITFGDTESLRCFVTVPYMRVPLTIDLLASRGNTQVEKKAEPMLRAMLYEVGEWTDNENGQNECKEIPTTKGTATSFGPLAHECKLHAACFVPLVANLVQTINNDEVRAGKHDVSPDSFLLWIRTLAGVVQFIMAFSSNRTLQQSLQAVLVGSTNSVLELLQQRIDYVVQLCVTRRAANKKKVVDKAEIQTQKEFFTVVALLAHRAVLLAGAMTPDSDEILQVGEAAAAAMIAFNVFALGRGTDLHGLAPYTLAELSSRCGPAFYALLDAPGIGLGNRGKVLNRIVELATLKRRGSVTESWSGSSGVYACRSWQIDLTLGLLRGPTGEQPGVLPRVILDHPDYIAVLSTAAPIGIVTNRFRNMTEYEVDFEHRRLVFELWNLKNVTAFSCFVPDLMKPALNDTQALTICNKSYMHRLETIEDKEVLAFVREVTEEAVVMSWGGKDIERLAWAATSKSRDACTYPEYRFASVCKSEELKEYVLEMHVYKRFGTLVAHIWVVVTWCARIHRQLVWTSNCHLALGTLMPPHGRARTPTARLLNSAGSINLTKEIVGEGGYHLRVLVHRAEGPPMENLPTRYLFGVVPEAVMDYKLAWLLPGYVTFVSRGQLPPNNSAAARDVRAADPTGESNIIVEYGRDTAHIKWGDRKLLNITVYDKREEFVDEGVELFNRMDFMSHLLVHIPPDPLNGIEFLLPRTGLRFGYRPYISVDGSKEHRLASLAHSGLFVSNKRGSEYWDLMGGLPHGILLENEAGDIFVLLPRYNVIRPVMRMSPLSVHVVIWPRTEPQMDGSPPPVGRSILVPVHPCAEFFQPENLEASLYLVFLKCLRRQYSFASRLVEQCQTDQPLTIFEQQVQEFLRLDLGTDWHPDFISVLLRLFIALDFAVNQVIKWDEALEGLVLRYLIVCHHVSAECRLTKAEMQQLVPSLKNPLQDWVGCEKGKTITPSNKPIVGCGIGRFSNFNANVLEIRTGWTVAQMHFKSSNVHKYTRPEKSKSSGAWWEDEVVVNALSSSSQSPAMRFFLLYDIITGGLSSAVMSPDFARLLFAYMIVNDMGNLDALYGLFQIIALTSNLSTLPSLLPVQTALATAEGAKIEVKRPETKGAPSQLNPLATFFASVHQATEKVTIPVGKNPPVDGGKTVFVPGAISLHRMMLSDVLCEVRELHQVYLGEDSSVKVHFGFEEARALSTAMLGGLAKRWFPKVEKEASPAVAPPHHALLSEVIEASPLFAKDGVAKRYLALLRSADEAANAVESGGPEFVAKSLTEIDAVKAKLQSIQLALRAQQKADFTAASAAHLFSRQVCNYAVQSSDETADKAAKRQIYELLLRIKQIPRVSLQTLARLVISSKAFEDLEVINPYISKENGSRAYQTVMVAMLYFTRYSHAASCIHKIRDAIRLADQASQPRHLRDLNVALQAVAKELHVERCYMDIQPAEKRPVHALFNPKYLAFEFLFRVTLWKRQLDLVQHLADATKKNNSAVVQLLMGQGKSSVVAPLLSMTLSELAFAGGGKKGIVTVTVPRQLLLQTRLVLGRRYTLLTGRPVFTFECTRQGGDIANLYRKIKLVEEHRGILLTAPDSIKAAMLRLVEEKLDGRKPTELPEIIARWQRGFLLVDEADYIMNPLRSELNFPVGAEKLITTGRLRWLLAMHLLARGLQLLENGVPSQAVQGSPHLTLVSTQWFNAACAVPLAEAAVAALASEEYDGVLTDADVADPATVKFLAGEIDTLPPALSERLSNLPLYRLAKFWIQYFCPHVLSKVNRVNYGVVEGTSRKYAAIPFTAKDCPCMESEFSHPDIMIGLTYVGFRHSGLGPSDVAELMQQLLVEFSGEPGVAEQRAAYLAYESFFESGSAQAGVPPLPQVEQKEELINAIHAKIRFQVSAIHRFLDITAFPVVLHFPPSKLSSSSQELGNKFLFKTCVGFTGTSDELVPRSITVVHALPDMSSILHILGDPAVVEVTTLPKNWTVPLILDYVVREGFDALIDPGGIITNISNEDVGKYVLAKEKAKVTSAKGAAVFLDPKVDTVYFIARNDPQLRSRPILECTVPLHQRFLFFDQMHCTGVDLPQASDAHAAITIGKDMNLRDLAQAAWRMRRLGPKGQTITLIVPPETAMLITDSKSTTLESGDLRRILTWMAMQGAYSSSINEIKLNQQEGEIGPRRTAFSTIMAGSGKGPEALKSFVERIANEVPKLFDGNVELNAEVVQQQAREQKEQQQVVQQSIQVIKNALPALAEAVAWMPDRLKFPVDADKNFLKLEEITICPERGKPVTFPEKVAPMDIRVSQNFLKILGSQTAKPVSKLRPVSVILQFTPGTTNLAFPIRATDRELSGTAYVVVSLDEASALQRIQDYSSDATIKNFVLWSRNGNPLSACAASHRTLLQGPLQIARFFNTDFYFVPKDLAVLRNELGLVEGPSNPQANLDVRKKILDLFYRNAMMCRRRGFINVANTVLCGPILPAPPKGTTIITVDWSVLKLVSKPKGPVVAAHPKGQPGNTTIAKKRSVSAGDASTKVRPREPEIEFDLSIQWTANRTLPPSVLLRVVWTSNKEIEHRGSLSASDIPLSESIFRFPHPNIQDILTYESWIDGVRNKNLLFLPPGNVSLTLIIPGQKTLPPKTAMTTLKDPYALGIWKVYAVSKGITNDLDLSMMKSKQITQGFGSFAALLQTIQLAPRLASVSLPPLRGDEIKALVDFLNEYHPKLTKLELTGIIESAENALSMLLPLMRNHAGLNLLKISGSRLTPSDLGKLERARESTKCVVQLV